MFNNKKCKRCEEKIKESYDFCPYCGLDLRNPEKDMEDFGMLGKNNFVNGSPLVSGGSFGISDRMISSIFNSLIKNLEKQMGNAGLNQNVQSFPNGIKIQVGTAPMQKKRKVQRKVITKEQIEKMTGLPRVEAKANVRRLSDKVVYELDAPGIESVDDIFVSKLEKGYEIKAIGKKKVYVNNIPVNLPLRGYAITETGLDIEFGLH